MLMLSVYAASSYSEPQLFVARVQSQHCGTFQQRLRTSETLRAGPYYVRIRSQQAMILDQFIAEAGLILLSVFFGGVEFLKQEFTA